ncbi:PD-(D/E)XK nuclease family protein [Desulfovibrio litoralis]|uniref:PD-(D/E)XK nuclease superfamily protein n=1 Tax=Desulfovibrio litoralis DSM 11393 TaxID=1121455 RepID=A0A1M7SLE8_9BACT|nr:PD-(D/E)XK nuclease family protein [Desulfovibrio litoralis]SHN59256.1 PD-(D/E)XK nuclease superfamily protein [Desulfovibrio litoralis DSM 11393]
MSFCSDFILIPWQEDFIFTLSSLIMKETEGQPNKALVVFPHSRPARYLREAFYKNQTIPKPVLLPECITVQELRRLICSKALKNKANTIGLLDQLGFLHQIILELKKEAPEFSSLHKLPLDDFSLFLPWGVRLINLFEDCWQQNKDPENLDFLEGEVQEYASALLASLRAISNKYSLLLQEKKLTTNGFEAFKAAAVISELDNYTASGYSKINGIIPNWTQNFLVNKKILLAGFYNLEETEEVIFKGLWRHFDTKLCLHSAPELLEGLENIHCLEHSALIKRWGARVEGFSLNPKSFNEKTKQKPTLRIWEGYDLHSELTALRHEFDSAKNVDIFLETSGSVTQSTVLESTAVILPYTELLLPTLHTVPNKDVNISMGYPLAHSSLLRLIDLIMRLRENVNIKEQMSSLTRETIQENPDNLMYYWKDLQELYRNPLLKALNHPELGSFASLLQKLETKLLEGEPYISIDVLLNKIQNERFDEGRFSPAERDAIFLLHKICLKNFAQISTAKELSLALVEFVLFLQEHAESRAKSLDPLQMTNLWEHFSLDAECLYRLLQKIIPEFANSVLSDKTLPIFALFALLRNILEGERVPFEGEPLTGLQIIGFLEARLLNFKKLFILDLTEDKLPGNPPQDPLLPEALRAELGLSSRAEREDMLAHHFWRLYAGADEVVLFTRSEQSAGALLDERKQRSRFIEELIWEAEQEKGRLLQPEQTQENILEKNELKYKEDDPLRIILSDVKGIKRNFISIPKTQPFIIKILKQLEQGGVSATFLDAYLRCPFRFALERLAKLKEFEGVNEEDDPREVGKLLHQVLCDFFKPYLNKVIEKQELDFNELKSIFLKRLNELKSEVHLPADSWLMLEVTGIERLRRLIENFPETTQILHLEHSIHGELILNLKDKQLFLEQSSTFSTVLKNKTTLHCKLYGVIDRVDQRAGEVYILDYKTGSTPKIKEQFWKDEELWERLEKWNKEIYFDKNKSCDSEGLELFNLVSDSVESLQMPLYLYMLNKTSKSQYEHLKNAFWVELSESSTENALFSDKVSDEFLSEILDIKLPVLLEFILIHLLFSPFFYSRENRSCKYCAFMSSCKPNIL